MYAFKSSFVPLQGVGADVCGQMCIVGLGQGGLQATLELPVPQQLVPNQENKPITTVHQEDQVSV